MLPKTNAAKYASAHEKTTLLSSGKIRFDQTGMEFPATVTSAVLEAYASGRAFKRAIARRRNEAYDFSSHEPHIVPHRERDERHFLYCKLTKSTLPRDAETVQTHVKAKRFRRQMVEVEKAKQRKEILDEKRREKRARAKVGKTPDSENQQEEVAEQPQDQAEGDMGEDADVLQGIISDDDESASDEDMGDETSEPVQATQVEPDADKEMAEVEETVKERKDTYWTRSRRLRKATAEQDDADDDGEEKAEKRVTRSSKSSKQRAIVAPKGSDASTDVPSQDKATITGKRKRVKVQVPKKVQQQRRRRKHAHAASP